MNPREQRGLELADAAKISRNGRGWVVPSQAGTGRYNVTLDGNTPRCTCPDYEIRGHKCKHIYAVEYTLEKEVSPNGETTITEDEEMLPDIGMGELIILLAIILLLFGAGRIPELARALGAGAREFRKGISEGAPEDREQKDREKRSPDEGDKTS